MVKPEASACWVFTVTPALTVSLSTAPSRPELYTRILVSVGERSVPRFNTSLRKWWSFPSGKGEENSAPGVSLPWEACGSLQWFVENSATKSKISISTKGIVKATGRKALMIHFVK